MTDEAASESEGEAVDGSDDHQAYLEERRALIDAGLEASKGYDKYMVTLASGALALAFLFIEKVAPDPVPWTYGWLGASLVLFAFCLVVMLFSMLLSQHSFDRQREIVDHTYRVRTGTATGPVKPVAFFKWLGGRLGLDNPWTPWLNQLARAENPYSAATDVCNVGGFVLFVAGVLAFVAFAFPNLHRHPHTEVETMAKPETRPAPDPSEKRGAGAWPQPVPRPQGQPKAPSPSAPGPEKK